MKYISGNGVVNIYVHSLNNGIPRLETANNFSPFASLFAWIKFATAVLQNEVEGQVINLLIVQLSLLPTQQLPIPGPAIAWSVPQPQLSILVPTYRSAPPPLPVFTDNKLECFHN